MPVLKEKPTDFKAGITLQSEGPAVFSHCFNNTIKEEVFTLVSKLTALLRICQVVNTNSYYLIFFTFALIQNIKLCAFAVCNVSELKMFILWLQLKILVNINTKILFTRRNITKTSKKKTHTLMHWMALSQSSFLV